MKKINLPRGILSSLEKLCPSLFVNAIFLTRGLPFVFTKDVEIGQSCLEISQLYSNG